MGGHEDAAVEEEDRDFGGGAYGGIYHDVDVEDLKCQCAGYSAMRGAANLE